LSVVIDNPLLLTSAQQEDGYPLCGLSLNIPISGDVRVSDFKLRRWT